MPGCMPDEWHGYDQTEEESRETNSHEEHDTGGPEQHRAGIPTAGDEAGYRCRDRIGLVVEHQRQGDDTDGKDKSRKKATDSEIDEREIGLLASSSFR
jgi:hypothetical protein